MLSILYIYIVFDIDLFYWHYPLLILAGFIAGFINTMAGGGSLITLPLMIFMGLPSSVANGTNRIAIFMSAFSASAGFKSKGVSNYPFNVYLGLSALFGALIGAQIAVDIKGEIFNKILAIIMIIVVITIVFKPKIDNLEVSERIVGKHLFISIIAFFFIGIYGGFINAGIGFVIMLFLHFYNKLNLINVNATKVVIVLIYTTGAIITFAIAGKINWIYAFFLASGNFLGGWFSSRWSVKKGEKVIKVFLLIMVIFMSMRLWFFNT
ncbi:MAG: sulfite exporter TauE/SafE family protein [Flavobacteriaceae bacterium]|nr:sulfite exporter TauE/SafE family protein [Flavobacteriaceae bacterium]